MTSDLEGTTQLQADVAERLRRAGIPEDYITDVLYTIAHGESAREHNDFQYHVDEANRLADLIDKSEHEPKYLIRLFDMHIGWLERHYPDERLDESVIMYQNW